MLENQASQWKINELSFFSLSNRKELVGEKYMIDKSNQPLKVRFATKRACQYTENSFREHLRPNHTLKEECVLILKST